jgi:VWFA-related protein
MAPETRRIFGRVFGVMFGLGALGALALGAETAPPAAAPPTVFDAAIDVRVVNVEAVVTDGKGQPVRGLGLSDLKLTVDGKEVPIEYFTEVAEGKAGSGGPQSPQSPVAAGEEVGRSYLLFVDDAFSLGNVRDQALANVERDLKLLHPDDRMAVLAFDGDRIEVLSDWTGDAAVLASALQRARQRKAAGGEMLAHQRKLQKDVDVILENEIDDGDTNPLTNNIGREMEALTKRISPEARTVLGRTSGSAAAALRAFPAPPGRKVMLLLSAAWTMNVAPQVYAPLVEAANRLGYTIYPTDMGQSSPTEVTAIGKLAGFTGGRVIVSAKLDPFRDVVADSGTYYWLGFTPTWKADDRGHAVAVVARRPGLQVRSRGGFSDLSKRTENAMKAESVLLFGGSEKERRLIVRLGTPKPAGRGELEIPVTVGVPVESLALTPKGSGYLAEAPMAVAVMDSKGGRADLPGSRLQVELKAAPAAGTFARFAVAVKVRDREQRLVFSVRDPIAGTSLWGEADYVPAKGR